MTSILQRLQSLPVKLGLGRDWYLMLVAAGIGIVMGGVATAFILPIRSLERLAESADPEALLWLVPLTPILGGLLTAIVTNIIWIEGGSGVSAVIYAVHRLKSRVPLRMALRKWLGATLTIASGGSAGPEGPIVTIGSAAGSSVGQFLHVSPQQTATLLGCGAAAGIASVFNAPIAGIFFVMEVLLRDFSLRTFTPIVIAAVASAVWTQTMLGTNTALFGVETGFFRGSFTLVEAPNFIALGILCGVVAALFVRAMFWTEERVADIPLPRLFKPALGGAALGLLGLAYILWARHQSGMTTLPPFYGNGYAFNRLLLEPGYYFSDASQGVLRPIGWLLPFLAAVAALKFIATCLTLGTGGVGGLFAPSLLLGAAVGGAVGVAVNALHLAPAANPAHYALVGMAAVLAGTSHAPLTGILLVYEITRSYEIILPLMLAAVVATIVARFISRDSVYTWRLTRAGLRIGAMSDLTILRRLSVHDVPLLPPVTVRSNESAQRLLELSEQHSVVDFIVVDDTDRYVGMVTGAAVQEALVYREAIPLLQVHELERTDLPTIGLGDTLDLVLDKFASLDVQSLAVLDDSAGSRSNGKVLGLITRSRLMRTYQDALREE